VKKANFSDFLRITPMADDTEKASEVHFTPSVKTWKYLEWLSRHTVLGKNPHAVAEQLLIQRLTEMRLDDYKQPDKE
jgi:hypothetical protein